MTSYRNRLPVIRFSARSRWVYGLVFPWFMPLIGYLLFGSRYFTEWRVFLVVTIINLLIGTVTFFGMDALVVAITHRFPGLNQTMPRVLSILAAFAIVTPLVILGGFWLYSHFSILNYSIDYATVGSILLTNVMANIVSAGVYEGIYYVTEWQASTAEKEQLRKANLQSQLDSLQQQVSPHFLFNSLNSLLALIGREPPKAEQYVYEMANVYRYLMQANRDGELTSLEKEVAFIRSYGHLLKTRFGESLRIEIAIDEAYAGYFLPPLTLQLLVENAVKHNVVRVSKPLLITIRTLPDSRLEVRNNLQRKLVQVASNRVGLSNIAAKYRLISQRDIEIEQTDESFIVTVPLLMANTVNQYIQAT